MSIWQIGKFCHHSLRKTYLYIFLKPQSKLEKHVICYSDSNFNGEKQMDSQHWIHGLCWFSGKCLLYVIGKTLLPIRSMLKKGILSYSDSSSPTFTREKRTGHSIFAKTAKTSCSQRRRPRRTPHMTISYTATKALKKEVEPIKWW